ncbi:CDP-glycerol glycerophosphotransferase family protein [Bacteroides fragilis]|uniref:CDP-glycerol glycerophosphotransferase family protein n=1 Tax=Bacteroides TaxID=816 RepID=UPI000C761EE5|nr:CDP-glycerol glycerophosphotransferase family protein [Bacteroides fragilis]AUI45723.1 hypothetical protein BUN20_03305 [Bacteroides fragilis]MCE8558638.1 CDP-glycerol glycerophosphotransferase family protein [Bacteroides fragilis]MCM0271537.1 CDP-glycerol glycerophosphotransferase family protein [Bacteroides fragilis]MCX8463999.1 CDP-glycerol glycerophosphotransferase family protein [Bacteroides fragilis]MCZ2615425.1 CDP-glycerol glycerophosphotransferase family protein [Bacteroides fragil
MNKIKEKIKYLLIGILIYPFKKICPIQKGIWIFGAQGGEKYVQNSKYLFEYVLRHSANAFWVTQSKSVYLSLKEAGLPVLYNLSFKGIRYVLTAEYVVFSTEISKDILYTCKRDGRKIINVWHGMPMKKIGFDHTGSPNSLLEKVHSCLWNIFIGSLRPKDIDFMSSTSPFFTDILKKSFRISNVFDFGEPRTDAFYSWNLNQIRKKMGFAEEDYVILYMPTHRNFGRGEMNPSIFKSNGTAIDYFKENNITVIWKFHINMLRNYKSDNQCSSVFRDFSLSSYDPQELLFVADMLITDYSSCYIDYLLLHRPVLFYLYDDYETQDNEIYFSSLDHNLGDVCHTEIQLLEAIKKRIKLPNQFIPNIIYHSHHDGKSCERIYNYIIEAENRDESI